MQAFATAAQSLAPEWEKLDAEWKAEFGETPPTSPEDWIRAAVRAGIDPNRLFDGTITAAEIAPVLEGYLLRLREVSQVAENVAAKAQTQKHAPPAPETKRAKGGRPEKFPGLSDLLLKHPQLSPSQIQAKFKQIHGREIGESGRKFPVPTKKQIVQARGNLNRKRKPQTSA